MSGKTYGHGPEFDAATFYSTSDAPDMLHHDSPEDAVADHLAGGGSVPVRVHAWKRKSVTERDFEQVVESMIERFEEMWWEEYGDPDGDYPPWSDEARDEVSSEVQSLLHRRLARAHVWQCEVVATAEITADDVGVLGLVGVQS